MEQTLCFMRAILHPPTNPMQNRPYFLTYFAKTGPPYEIVSNFTGFFA